MADETNDEFEAANAGASDTFPQQCSALRKNGYVLLKDKPCKIVEMTTSKTGKHGHAKVHLVGIDIFTQKKYEDICPSTHNMNVPVVSRVDLACIDHDAGFLSLMGEDNLVRDDVKLPEGDLGNEIIDKLNNGENFQVTLMRAMGHEQVIGIKAMNQ